VQLKEAQQKDRTTGGKTRHESGHVFLPRYVKARHKHSHTSGDPPAKVHDSTSKINFPMHVEL